MVNSLEIEITPKVEENSPLALVFIKPGYSKSEVIQEVEGGFRDIKASIFSKGIFQFTREKANEFYRHNQGKPIFNTYSGYISSGTVTYFIVSGSKQENQEDFYIKVRELANDIRDRFGRKKEGTSQRKGANPIHSSSSFEEAKRELEILGLELKIS
jgi:nucleoside diphosphate kinase